MALDRSVSHCMVVRLILLLLGVSAARAHEALFEPASFGWTTDTYELSWPLTGARYGARWLFRGLNASTAEGSIALVAGQTVDLEIGCSRSNVEDKHQACADDPGSLHSIGGARTGCGLAISYKRARPRASRRSLPSLRSYHVCRPHRVQRPARLRPRGVEAHLRRAGQFARDAEWTAGYVRLRMDTESVKRCC